MSQTVTKVFTATVGATLSFQTIVSSPSATVAAASILEAPHVSPTVYNPANPFTIFCIQAGIIVIFAQILAFFLGKLRQPRVIAEVIAGILLGPSVFGRIPGFTENIFPPQTLPYLNLVSTIGLTLFLFLVGMEVDFGVFKRNAKPSLTISIAGLVIPFGLGAAVSKGLYDKYVDADQVSYAHFLLFTAVAMSITAFPVLCRILTELRLLNTDVGVTVLAAGVGNDVVGWTLLALTIALVNAGSGVVAVYVILCAVGWTLFLCFPVRAAFIHFCRKQGSFEKGPSNLLMFIIFIMILASSFVTDIIGVHAMFGGFLVGVIMPHHKGFCHSITEKIEDLVTVLFLPIYFAVSGLKTNLGLLNNGSIWGWAICVIVVAFFSKFSGCFLSARYFGYTWREAGAVGSLMSCKGLVELIVLNIGLQAGILNNAIFAMFVLMALVTTFLTTPLTLLFYPMHYRVKLAAERAGKKGVEAAATDKLSMAPTEEGIRNRFTFVLNRFEHLPLVMSFTKMVQTPLDYDAISKSTPSLGSEGKSTELIAVHPNAVHLDAIRLVEVTDRLFTGQQGADSEQLLRADPLSNTFSTFAALNAFDVTPQLTVLHPADFADAVRDFAEEKSSQMILVPWAAAASASYEDGPTSSHLENLFRGGASAERSPEYASFVRKVFLDASCDVGLFMDQGILGKPSAIPGGRQHIFMAFHGGPDDRAALELILQLCRHPGVSATIVRFIKTAPSEEDELSTSSSNEKANAGEGATLAMAQYTVHGGISGGDTIYGIHDTQHQLQSDTADNLALAQYWPEKAEGAQSHNAATQSALSRMNFTTVCSATPLKASLAHAEKVGQSIAGPLLVVVGRSRRGAASHRDELAQILKEHVSTATDSSVSALGIAASSEVRKTLGDLGSAVVVKGLASSLLVIQSKA